MSDWEASAVRPLALEALGERYRRYRLCDPAAEEAMARSLQRYGQIAPVVVCVHDGSMEVVDGFKRLAAARLLLPRWTTLSVRVLAVDARGAKAAIYGLNRVSRATHELEEAWIVHALVREDGMSQVEAAALLGRHKSWVCRRLALLERLGDEAKAGSAFGVDVGERSSAGGAVARGQPGGSVAHDPPRRTERRGGARGGRLAAGIDQPGTRRVRAGQPT